jgi:hypothetical protein
LCRSTESHSTDDGRSLQDQGQARQVALDLERNLTAQKWPYVFSLPCLASFYPACNPCQMRCKTHHMLYPA